VVRVAEQPRVGAITKSTVSSEGVTKGGNSVVCGHRFVKKIAANPSLGVNGALHEDCKYGMVSSG
jgi:hypothetical protein